MAITAQDRQTPAERREIDIATAPMEDMRQYREDLQQRIQETSRQAFGKESTEAQRIEGAGAYQSAVTYNRMVGDAINAREQGLEVNQSDRETLLRTEEKRTLAEIQADGRKELVGNTSERYVADMEQRAREQGMKVDADWYRTETGAVLETREYEASRASKGAVMSDRNMEQTPVATPSTPEQKLEPEQERRSPPAQMSNQQIMAETRELHSEYKALYAEYQNAPPAERQELREAMQPIVARENELRAEYTSRVAPEISRDRVPEQSVGVGF
jgi:hypothetical protein